METGLALWTLSLVLNKFRLNCYSFRVGQLRTGFKLCMGDAYTHMRLVVVLVTSCRDGGLHFWTLSLVLNKFRLHCHSFRVDQLRTGLELCMGDAYTHMRGCIYIYVDCCAQDASVPFIRSHLLRSNFQQ